jgi:hypothetical protein
MSYFYVLTYFGKYPEHWLRTSAIEIIDCIQDFMKDNEEEFDFCITLHEFDKEKYTDLEKELCHIKDEERITSASKLDELYSGKCLKTLPDDIFWCKDCVIYTEKESA